MSDIQAVNLTFETDAQLLLTQINLFVCQKCCSKGIICPAAIRLVTTVPNLIGCRFNKELFSANRHHTIITYLSHGALRRCQP